MLSLHPSVDEQPTEPAFIEPSGSGGYLTQPYASRSEVLNASVEQIPLAAIVTPNGTESSVPYGMPSGKSRLVLLEPPAFDADENPHQDFPPPNYNRVIEGQQEHAHV